MPFIHKKPLIKIFSLILALALLANLPTSVSALTFIWQSQTPDSNEEAGLYTSLAIVNGNPAISYLDRANEDLKYIRANDANGISWGTPVTLDSAGSVGYCTSLAIANGNPAISYFDFSNQDLKYVRANDANGTSWGTPQTLDSNGFVGSDAVLAIVNGNPAISYFDFSNGSLKYIRANDANGTSWGTPQTLDSNGFVGAANSLAVINGNPAISYLNLGDLSLKYIHANDANGISWDTPQTLDSNRTIGYNTSLAVVNGNPAISYYYDNGTNHDIKYIRANDASGTSWGTPQIPDSLEKIGYNISLVVINGNPAISYYDSANQDLKYIRANDANGISWDTPQTPDSAGNVGSYLSMVFMNGNPAISYYDYTNHNLKFIIPLGTVDLALLETGNPINSGSTLSFGSTTLSNPIIKTLTLQNNGNLPLGLDSLSLPNGFSQIGSYETSLPAGSSIDIQVRLDAIQTGNFSGALTIQSPDTENSPYSISLTGEVITPRGEIAVLDGSTDIPDDSGSVNFGTTVTGTPVTKTFTFQNSGAYDLDLGTLSLPNGFSLVGSYASSVSPGSSTILQVRLDAQASGTYSGEFSLANNDADENPFNFTLNGIVTAKTLEAPLLSPVSGSTILESPIQVAFNQPVKSDGGSEAANNPANYLLMEAGNNGLFDTVSCAAGISGDDVEIVIGSVAYESSTYIATINPDPLPTGMYQIMVCGTASIEGLSGNVLNNGLYDSSTFFTVISNESNQDGGGTLASLPATGFTPDQLTHIPTQPESREYSELSDLNLEIPALKLELPIVGVPQTAVGWDVTWLTNAQIGWLNGSAFPTWEGNTVLTGHVTNASGQPGAFAEIQQLKYGDMVFLQAYGKTYTYEVRENVLALPNNLSSVMQSREHDWLTLMTCEYYNELSGDYLFRRVIRAVLVEME